MAHILIVSSEPYKVDSVPLGGIFQEHQGIALAGCGHRVGIASGGVMPLRSMLSTLPPNLELNAGLVISRRFVRSFVPLRFRSEARLHDDQIALLIAAIENYVRVNGKPNLLHAHNLQYAALAASRCATAMGIPFCITEHSSAVLAGSMPIALREEFQRTALTARGVACVSTALASALETFLELPTPPTVIPNILDAELEAAARAYTPQKLESHPFTFLAIGRLDKNKNQALLLRAFAQCNAQFASAPAKLLIAGTGGELTALRQLAIELGIESRVDFLGMQNRAGIFNALRRSHVLVQTSMVETFGVSLIEALAFGLPVLSTPSGGPSSILKNPEDGEILPDHDPETLARALRDVMHRFEKYNRHDIQQRALDTYGSSSFCRLINQWYADLKITDQ